MMYIAFLLAVLATVYALTLASFAWQDLTLGLALASVLLLLFRAYVLPKPLPKWQIVVAGIVFFPKLVAMILSDVLRGTWLVASIVTGLRPLSHPGILKLPMRDHGNTGVAVVSFILTLSPGSFVVGYDWDERVILVHYIDISDPDQLRADIERYYWLWERKPKPAPAIDEEVV